jgi:hypothetical protein
MDFSCVALRDVDQTIEITRARIDVGKLTGRVASWQARKILSLTGKRQVVSEPIDGASGWQDGPTIKVPRSDKCRKS